MRGFLVGCLLFLVLGAGAVFLLTRETQPDPPVVTLEPAGISQSTVSEIAIKRPAWLAADGKLVWLSGRLGEATRRDVCFLVNLATQQTALLLEDAEPLAWLSPTEVLLFNESVTGPVWQKITRKFGGRLKIERTTRFYRLNVDNGEINNVADVVDEIGMNAFSHAPNGQTAVATWGPERCREIDLANGQITSVTEKYVWSPCFVSDKEYLFVGETALQKREVGSDKSSRASQPLLTEIRDAIKIKGIPSLEICGRYNDQIFVVDHVVQGSQERLLKVDPLTRLLQEVGLLEPSRGIPSFSPDLKYVVYQGNPFDRTWDRVYLQTLEPGSQSEILVESVAGQTYQSTPHFLPDGRILYVYRGIDLRALTLEPNGEELVWPQSLLP